jgi:predicted lysophospholipase L1 biosynthesis ABC-type transport system permease subunit
MPPGLGLLRTVLRRIRADWAVLLASVVTLLLAGMLVSSAPIYSRAVNDAGLQRALNDADATEANIEISGRYSGSTFPNADELILEETARLSALSDAELYRYGRSDSFAFPDQEDVRDLTVFAFFQSMEDFATLVEGSWPETTDAPYQVAISEDTSEMRELSVGDEIAVIYRHEDDFNVPIQITGIYQVDDPSASYWYDSELDTAGFSEGQSFDTYGPLVVTPSVFFQAATPRTSWVGWRLFPNFDEMTTSTAPEVRRETNRLTSRINNQEFFEGRINVATRLNSLIARIERSLLVTQASVTIVIVQLTILAGYALVLTSRLIVDHRQVETTVLRARGASSRQLFSLSLLEAVCLALPLIVIAPVLSMLALHLFNLYGPLADINLQIEPRITSGAYLASSITGLIGVLLLSLPVLRDKESKPGSQPSRHRQESESLWQRAGIDLAVLVIAAVGFFQLRRYSSTITQTVEGRLGIDPLLVAAPAIGLIAGAILALRIVPLIARVAERVAARQRAALIALGAWQIARRPLVYSRAMLLLLLAIGIGIFTTAYTQTWQQSQIDQANHRIGADIRVQPDTRFSRAIQPLTLTEAHHQIDGVVTSMPVNERLEQFGDVRDLGSLVLFDTEYADDAVLLRDDLQPENYQHLLAEMRRARPQLDAAVLPGTPARLALDVEIDPDIQDDDEEVDPADRSVQVWVTLIDDEGYKHRLSMGTLHPDDGDVELAADLTDDHGNGTVTRPVYPLAISALEFTTTGPQGGENRGMIQFSNWRISNDREGENWQALPVEELTRPDWRQSTHVFSGSTYAEMAVEGFDDTLSIYYEAGATAQVAIRTATFRIASPVPDVEGGVPVIISRPLQLLGDYRVGDTVLVPVGSFAFEGTITGVIDAFPGTNAHAVPAIIADLPTVVTLNERPAESPFGPTERWLALGGGDVDEIVDSLRAQPFTSRRVLASDQRAAELQQDPVALGTLGALALGFVAATAVAGAGIMASSAGSARQRMSEFLLMRAIGLSPRQLTGWLLLENSLLIVLGVIGGTLLGLLLGWLVLPLISLTQTADQVFPGVQIVIPWGTIGLLQLAGLGLLVLLTIALAVIVRRGGLGESLRVRDD